MMDDSTLHKLIEGIGLHESRAVDCLHKIETYTVRRVANKVAKALKRKHTIQVEPFESGYCMIIFRDV